MEAATGSGKTLAFVLPVRELLAKKKLRKNQVGAVILSPTRELAAQIHSVAKPFLATLPWIQCALLVGGGPVSSDARQLAEHGANVLVGTPGRLDDVMEKVKDLDFRELEILILDEADRLLDMGFQVKVASILARLPRQRRTGLFSATQTTLTEELGRAGMRNPTRVEVRVSSKVEGEREGKEGEGGVVGKTPITLEISYLVCEMEKKISHFVRILEEQSSLKTIVYALTCACVDYWNATLPHLPTLKKLNFFALHGKMKQSVREEALAKFSQLPEGVLLCTDVAARGLDIPGVDSIIQLDAPQDPKAFLHRAGRTARMGLSGSAFVLLTPKEDAYADYLRLQGIPLQEKPCPSSVTDVTPLLRQAALSDRDVMEKGLRAFVSFVRGYKEHHCNYIFRWKELELGRLGMAFGLLQLPAMGELKRIRNAAKHFQGVEGVDFDTIRYRDKGREKQRKQKLKSLSLEDSRGVRKTPEGGQAVEKVDRKSKSQKHKEVRNKRTARSKEDNDDEDLNSDYRLLKRLKKGKISENDFGRATGLGFLEPGWDEKAASDAEYGNVKENKGLKGSY